MENDKLNLAASLLEWTLESKNQWLEVAETDAKELVKIAERKGISLPSPDLAILKTYYAEVDKPNKNGVILPKEEVKKGLHTLIGKEVNFDHKGTNFICGYILDAKLEKTMIVVYACIFKSLWKDKFEEVQRKFAEGDLFVSFELWKLDPKTAEPIYTINSDGYKVITPIIFSGCGLLINKPPACPKASALFLLASENIIEQANKIIDPILDKDDRFVYAEMALPCQNCKECQSRKGEHAVENLEEAKKIGEPIDPNLFLKADGSLDEEKMEAALPKEVTARVKELIKEGKTPAEAVKQAWKEQKEQAAVVPTVEESTIEPVAEAAVEPKRCKTCNEPLVEGSIEEECAKCKEKAEQAATVVPEPVVAEVAIPSVAEANDAQPGHMNFTCPECRFTQPMTSEEADKGMPRYCPACGQYNWNMNDESPLQVEMNYQYDLPNEEEDHTDECSNLSEASKISYEKRQSLPDSDFAVVVKKGDRKIRKFPIQDEAHVRNALARLGQEKPRATLKSLGVSIESVKNKILNRAKKLGMTDLVEKHKAVGSLEADLIATLTSTINELTTKVAEANAAKEVAEAKIVEVEAKVVEVETEVVEIEKTLKASVEQKDNEIASLNEELGKINPVLGVGAIEVATDNDLKKARAKVDEMAFGKKIAQYKGEIHMKEYFERAEYISKLIGLPIDAQLDGKSIVNDITTMESAAPGEEVKIYTVEDTNSGDRIFSVNAAGVVTIADVTPQTPAVIPFTDVQSNLETMLLSQCLNSPDQGLIARRKRAITRGLNKRIDKEALDLILGVASQEVVPTSNEDIYSVIMDMVHLVEDYAASQEFVLYVGTKASNRIDTYDKDNALNFHYNVQLVETLAKKGIKLVKVGDTIQFSYNATPTPVLATDKMILVARNSVITAERPIAYVRRQISAEVAKQMGVEVDAAYRANTVMPMPIFDPAQNSYTLKMGIHAFEQRVLALLTYRNVAWTTVL